MFKKILSFLLVLSILFLCVIPVFAADDYSSNISSYWEYVLAVINQGGSALMSTDMAAFGYGIKGLASSLSDGEVCSLSSDGLHHYSYTGGNLSTGRDSHGFYALVPCTYCGKQFRAYSSDFDSSYNSYVSDNYPATSIADDGGLIWQVSFSDITQDVGFVKVGLGSGGGYFTMPYVDSTYEKGNYSVSISYTGVSYHCVFSNSASKGTGSLGLKALDNYIYVNAPIDGTYSLLETCMVNGSYIRYSNANSTGTKLSYWPTSAFNSGTAVFESSGSSLTIGGWNMGAADMGAYVKSYDFFFYLPQFKIVPTSDSSSGYNYGAGTRVGSINLDLASTTTVNNTVQIENIYSNTTIVNETNNTIYNPVTGDTYNINDWTYDYITRTYIGTLDGDVTFSVAFGDDAVHVELGDLSFELNYVTESQADTHTHEYFASDRTEPTCTQDGSVTYSCKVCGISYAETLPALGHAWRLAESVPATYTLDEATLVCPNCNGTDITYEPIDEGPMYRCTCADCDNTWTVAGSTVSGYDLYECTRCGLTYKDYTGEGVDRSDSAYWAWLQWWLTNFQAWLDGKLDGLEPGGTGVQLTPIVISPHAEVQPDLDITVDLGDGNVSSMSLLGIIGKFAWVVELWSAARRLVGIVSADAANAYEFNWRTTDHALIDDMGITALDGASETAAPTITVQLAESSGANSWFSGGDVTVIDFSWYTQYKPTVDKLLSGILWAVFIWQVFKKAPGIIRGESMAGGMIDNISRKRGKE